jgi:hypothetical protein
LQKKPVKKLSKSLLRLSGEAEEEEEEEDFVVPGKKT